MVADIMCCNGDSLGLNKIIWKFHITGSGVVQVRHSEKPIGKQYFQALIQAIVETKR